VHHIQSAPAPSYSKPVYSVPAVAKVAVPAPSYYSAPSASSYYSAPSASSYYSSPAPQYYSAPVAKVALPVAKIAVPVAKYAAVPSYSKEEYAPAKYEFAYSIADSHTGDHHSQEEKRDGDHVVGQYSLHEADGTVRIVKYSDEGHGFNAVVERQGEPAPAPVAYKKVVAVAAPKYY